jgi:hypothetical protein
MNIEPQYLEQVQKGSTVMYGNKPYRVQDDGKGFLHIIVFEPKRKKIAIENIQIWFEYGSEPDYIFNGWWKIYPTFEEFNQFASSEIEWLRLIPPSAS